MKHRKLLLTLTAVVLLSFGLFAFRQYQKIKTASEVFSSIIGDIAYPEWEVKQTKDEVKHPEAMITGKNEAGTEYYRDCASICEYRLGALLSNTIESSIKNEGEYFDEVYQFDEKYQKRFKDIFHADLMKAPLKMKAKDYLGNPLNFHQFNGEGFKTAFDKLYKSPNEDYEGVSMQIIYNISAKEYMREVAKVVYEIYNHKDFKSIAADYKKKALNDKNFEGVNFCYAAYDKMIKEDTKGCLPYGKFSILTRMLRRQIDGSLPQLIDCLNIILKDYDPEFYKTIKQ